MTGKNHGQISSNGPSKHPFAKKEWSAYKIKFHELVSWDLASKCSARKSNWDVYAGYVIRWSESLALLNSVAQS